MMKTEAPFTIRDIDPRKMSAVITELMNEGLVSIKRPATRDELDKRKPGRRIRRRK